MALAQTLSADERDTARQLEGTRGVGEMVKALQVLQADLATAKATLASTLEALDAPAQAGEAAAVAAAAVAAITGEGAAAKTLANVNSTLGSPAQAGEAAAAAEGKATAAKQDTIIAAVEAIAGEPAKTLADLHGLLSVPAEAATALVTFLANPDDGETLAIHETVYEYDTGVAATGAVAFSDGMDPAMPVDGNKVVVNDGVHDPVTFEMDEGAQATGSITLTSNPVENHSITIDDGGGPETLTFVQGTPDPGEVEIGLTAEATMVNLVIAINGAGTITATPSDPPDNICTLLQPEVGDAYNIPILKDGDGITVVGMEGGKDAGDAVQPGNVGVALVAQDPTATMGNLIDAINGEQQLDVTATAATPADNTCTLANDEPGDAGNVEITKVGDNIIVSGMAGGEDPGEAVELGNIGVPRGVDAEETRDNLVTAILGELEVEAVAVDIDEIFLTWPVAGTVGNGKEVTPSNEQTVTATDFADGREAVSPTTIQVLLAAILAQLQKLTFTETGELKVNTGA